MFRSEPIVHNPQYIQICDWTKNETDAYHTFLWAALDLDHIQASRVLFQDSFTGR